MKIATFRPQFVRAVPDALDNGVIYVSIEYRTAVHKCACGCGRHVITPLAPAQWRLIYDGKVSLHPSIGNWSFPCRSHYWIRNNAVAWAEQWSDAQIAMARTHDQQSVDRYYGEPPATPVVAAAAQKNSLWSRLWYRLSGGR
jgi:hypothetical protein